MSDVKKPLAGEWWISKGTGRPVYIVGMDPDGDTVFMDDPEDKANVDLVNEFIETFKHEPDCTGFDWMPETFPQYWTTVDSHSSVAFMKRLSATHYCFVEKNGSESPVGTCGGMPMLEGRKQLTEAEALALLEPAPQPQWQIIEIGGKRYEIREAQEAIR